MITCQLQYTLYKRTDAGQRRNRAGKKGRVYKWNYRLGGPGVGGFSEDMISFLDASRARQGFCKCLYGILYS